MLAKRSQISLFMEIISSEIPVSNEIKDYQ